MGDVEYDLYKHRTLSNKWKVVRDGSVPPDCWMPIYHVIHRADNGKVVYEPK